MRLSIVVTTIGRPTLVNTLNSLAELGEEDDVIICCDGLVPQILDVIQDAKIPTRRSIVFHAPMAKDWGHTLRNQYSKLARGDYVLHIDDDDCYIPGALDKVRKECKESAGRLVVFGMCTAGGVVPREKDLRFRNIGTPNGAIPNIPHRWGTWANRHGGDFDFYAGCDFELAWREQIVISAIRPHEWNCPDEMRPLLTAR